MAETTKDYLIGSNQHASARLNLQHYWATLTCGYLLHPDITVEENARIADVATGTAIWPVSLSLSLPASVQIHGFDSTDAQFPPREWLSPNVRLEKLDILAPVPEELRGQYDVVAIRFFSLIVKNNDIGTLLKNLLSLLKPGGYLQWIESDISASQVVSSRADVCTQESEAFMRDAKQFLKDFNISYDWLHKLPSSCKEYGMINVVQYSPPIIAAVRPIFAYGTVGAYEEFSYSILDKYGPIPSLGSGDDLRKRLDTVREELQAGVAIEQPIYILVARMPLEDL